MLIIYMIWEQFLQGETFVLFNVNYEPESENKVILRHNFTAESCLL